MYLKPCPYRHADDEGHILCDKIKSGDREVSPNICRACPVAHINCTHLRATLDHQARPPIVVRWGNGKSQVWDDVANDSIALTRAACAVKVIPIHSPRDCAGCALRLPVESPQSTVASSQTADPSTSLRAGRRPTTTAPRVVRRAPIPAPLPQPVAQVNQRDAHRRRALEPGRSENHSTARMARQTKSHATTIRSGRGRADYVRTLSARGVVGERRETRGVDGLNCRFSISDFRLTQS